MNNRKFAFEMLKFQQNHLEQNDHKSKNDHAY